MCGRFSFSTTTEKIIKQLGPIATGKNLKINFNVAPTQEAYVITNQHPNRLDLLKWGLVPYWAKDTKNAGRLINARSEGISDKPSFRSPIRKRRCLVLADSFYEWKRIGKEKIPYRIFPENGDLLVMAGIWEVWDKGEAPLETFSIITTEPNQEMQSIHNRMPVLLTNREEQQRWLDFLSIEEVLELLKTPADGLLSMYQVSTQVNSVRNNGPELHQEVPEQQSLF